MGYSTLALTRHARRAVGLGCGRLRVVKASEESMASRSITAMMIARCLSEMASVCRGVRPLPGWEQSDLSDPTGGVSYLRNRTLVRGHKSTDLGGVAQVQRFFHLGPADAKTARPTGWNVA